MSLTQISSVANIQNAREILGKLNNDSVIKNAVGGPTAIYRFSGLAPFPISLLLSNFIPLANPGVYYLMLRFSGVAATAPTNATFSIQFSSFGVAQLAPGAAVTQAGSNHFAMTFINGVGVGTHPIITLAKNPSNDSLDLTIAPGAGAPQAMNVTVSIEVLSANSF